MQIRPAHHERDLADVGERIARAQETLRIAREQLAFQSDVLEDAKTRMLVSETPLADREFRIARGDYDRLARALRSPSFGPSRIDCSTACSGETLGFCDPSSRGQIVRIRGASSIE